jgi:hypothetical protein
MFPNLTHPSRFPRMPLMRSGDTGMGAQPWTANLIAPSPLGLVESRAREGHL